MKYAITTCLVCSSLLIQGCHAGPDTAKPLNKSIATPIQRSPTSAHTAHKVSPKDQQYVTLLQALEKKDPQMEAQKAIDKGAPSIIGYYSGRAGLKTPGLTTEQQAKQQCRLETVDGLGDVIYGENHLKYRIAIRNFAKAYNSHLLATCL